MREKVRDLVYLDTTRYTSLNNLRLFFWGIIFIPIIILIIGIVRKLAFPIVSIFLWGLLYWIFIFVIQNKHTKKTFQLRFLVNGISGLFLSSLFWIFFASFSSASNISFLSFNFLLWILIFYLVFSLVYIVLIILGVHKGIFARIREKNRTKTALIISSFFGALIPCSGVLGIYSSRLLRSHASISMQYTIITIIAVLVIFIPALAHINFVQYFYCKKYSILCDEYGNTTSPKLERYYKKKRTKREKNQQEKKKKLPLVIKILIGTVCIPIVSFVILFIIFFIKAITRNI